MLFARSFFWSHLKPSDICRHSPRFSSLFSSLSASSAASIEAERLLRDGPRNDWTRQQIRDIYDSPLLDLLFHGAQVHRHAHNFREVQQCTLLSIKTGGCSEDCSYCPQSSRYDTGVKAQKLMTKDVVLEAAKKAKEAGSTRFCMGAAWRDTIGRKTNFNQILDYVKEIREMGMEVCCTLGMIEKQQAIDLKKAGLTAYNHNLDTSREYYPNIITTRSYDERLKTLEFVRDAGINVCSGGIIGLGEAEEDRVGLLHTLATLPTHPESVPINALVAVKGTPLQDQKSSFTHLFIAVAHTCFGIPSLLLMKATALVSTPVEIWEMIRMIATARITMPKAMVRLSAGRVKFSVPEQALCFLAGANSIFTGEKLLTTPNNDFDADQLMFKMLGLIPKAPSFTEDAEKAPEEESLQEAAS
uniref:Radical SAM core domain-containing protein n=1 Tax=Cucumis melo TaxID=3656 RepID=A0A9I9D154_CUCME